MLNNNSYVEEMKSFVQDLGFVVTNFKKSCYLHKFSEAFVLGRKGVFRLYVEYRHGKYAASLSEVFKNKSSYDLISIPYVSFAVMKRRMNRHFDNFRSLVS